MLVMLLEYSSGYKEATKKIQKKKKVVSWK